MLLNEEMRRVLATFRWQADTWRKLGLKFDTGAFDSTDGMEVARRRREYIVREGMVAYASRQASIREQMRTHCLIQWTGLSSKLNTMDGKDVDKLVECH